MMKKWIANYKRKKVIRNIRDSFEWFGFNIDNFTDEELEMGFHNLAQNIAATGVSCQEAAEGMERAFEILRN